MNSISNRVPRLFIGQSIYLTPENVLDLKSSEIELIEYGIAKISKSGTIRIVDENGNLYSLKNNTQSSEPLCIGFARLNNSMYRGFLSEQDFWIWWEWSKLSRKLCRYIPRVVFEQPTVENLVRCRILYDLIIKNENRYQNISCRGCIHSISVRCTRCVRDKSLEDCWQGRDTQSKYQFE